MAAWPAVVFAGPSSPPVRPLEILPAKSTYQPGEKVEVLLRQELLAGAEECELLLKAPGLKVELVRLTPSVFGPTGTLSLLMPHLPGLQARLLLRAGSSGREWTAAVSEEFFIPPKPGSALPLLQKRQGEWWLAPPSGPWEPQGPSLSGWQKGFPALLPWLFGPQESSKPLRPPSSKLALAASGRLLARARVLPRPWQPPVNLPQRE